MANIGVFTAEIDSTKIIADTPEELVVPALLAREAVLKYPQGMAYRPADELEQSAFTFEGAWIVAKQHPEHMILTNPKQISGRITNIVFDQAVKGIRGHVHIDKRKVEPQFVEDIKAGKLKDVSIGFLYEEDWKPGVFNGEKYDYVQRNMLINHVAVGVPVGRMRAPLIGLSVDSAIESAVTNDVTSQADSFGDASFPDSCFAWVPDSAKGKDGNKSERKLPYKNADGSVDWPHVRNALARLDQTNGIPAAEKEKIRKMLQDLLASSKNPTNAGDVLVPESKPDAKPEPEKPLPLTQPENPVPKPETVEDIISENKKAVDEARKSLETRNSLNK